MVWFVLKCKHFLEDGPASVVTHLCPQSLLPWGVLIEGWVGEWVKGSQETDETVGQVKWLPQFVSACPLHGPVVTQTLF